MSSVPAAQPVPSAVHPGDREIRIVSHSNLFYWWPVWAVGFLIGAISLVAGGHMVIVPGDTEPFHEATVTGKSEKDPQAETKVSGRDALVLPQNDRLAERPLKLHATQTKVPGIIFAVTLLLVIVITNVPLRGMWSVVIIMGIIMLVIIFSLAGWWDRILGWLFLLHVHMNAAGYLLIAIILFAVWIITFLFFDQQVYIVFRPGQLKVCTEIGGGEQVYDTTGMTFEKQRSDLFRHWILGLGSGDLRVTTTGAAAHHFDLPNVLFIGKKVQQITDMMKEKEVVRGGR